MKSNRGFTLMEVVIAMAMLGVALGVSTYTTNLISSNYSLSRRMTRAHDVASLVLEELLAVYDSDTKITAGTHTQGYDDSLKKTATNPIFTATWVIKTNFPITKITEINLSVSWTENGKARAVRYVTYRSS